MVGHALTSGGSNEAPPPAAAAPAAATGYAPAPPPAAAAAAAPMYAPPVMAARGGLESGPCAAALADFVDCAQTQSDLTFCEGFNEALKQCRMDNGI